MLGLLGALLVPLAFLTVWQLTQSLPAAFLAGLAVLTGLLGHASHVPKQRTRAKCIITPQRR